MQTGTLELNLTTTGFNEKINETISKVKGFSENIQKTIENTTKRITKSLDEISLKIESISNSINGTSFIDFINSINTLTNFGSTLIDMGGAISFFVKSIRDMGLAATIAGIPLSTLLPIILGIASAIALVVLAVQHWDEIMAFLSENFGGAISAISDLFTTFWESCFKPIWDNLTLAIDWLWNKHLKPLLSNVVDFINEFIICIQPIVAFLVTILGPIFAQIFNFIVNVVGTAIAFVADIIGGFITVLEGVVQFITGIFTGNFGRAWEGIVNILRGVWDTIYGIVRFPINLIIDAINFLVKGIASIVSGLINIVVGGINNMIRGILAPINLLIDGLNLIPGVTIARVQLVIPNVPNFGQLIPSIPKLDVGTNYVPNDQLAMIHKGEAVVPKKFNSVEYFGKGNDRMEGLLETLINRVDAIDMNPYITVKDVGNASVKYINSESRIRGESVINI